MGRLSEEELKNIETPLGSKLIALSSNKYATIDEEDYEELNKHKWYYTKNGNVEYARTDVHGTRVYMHRLIMEASKDKVVDHINKNGLDNRKCNLRLCSKKQNHYNLSKRGGSSQYIGVFLHKCGKWQATIRSNDRYEYLGLYAYEEEAGVVYDLKCLELRGEFAYLNFPELKEEYLKIIRESQK